MGGWRGKEVTGEVEVKDGKGEGKEGDMEEIKWRERVEVKEKWMR